MKKIISLFFVGFVFIISFLYVAPKISNQALAVCTLNGASVATGTQFCQGFSYSGQVCTPSTTYGTCQSTGSFTYNTCPSGTKCGYNNSVDVSCFAACAATPTPTSPPVATPTTPAGSTTTPTPIGGSCVPGTRRCVGTSGSTTTYQTCQSNGTWGSNETCPTTGTFCYSQTTSPFASCKYPTGVTPTPTPAAGTNYTVSGKVFLDSAYSGSTSQTGMAGISVSIPTGAGISNGTSVTDSAGNYKITLPYNTGQYVYTVTVSHPKGYTISPGLINANGNPLTGNTISIGFSPTNAHPTLNFGIVTPPSSVKVDYGSYTINTTILEYDLFGGKPQVLIDQTMQVGGGGLPSGLSHALTDKDGKVSFTGIKTSEWGYALTPTLPSFTTIKTVIVNGVDIGARTPLKFAYWTVDMTGWNQSLMVPLGNGVVLFKGTELIYIDPAKNPAPLNVQWILNPPSQPLNYTGVSIIPYPNGGGFCQPVTNSGNPYFSSCSGLKNFPPGGVTGTGPIPTPTSAATPTITVTPTPAPIPVCDIVTSTGPCQGAVTNTCNTNNGTQTITYGNSSTGQQCQQQFVNTVCTYNNCNAGNVCQSGTCVNPTQPTNTPTVTVPPTNTPTVVPPTATKTPTPTNVPPTATKTPTPTNVPPTATNAPTVSPVPNTYNLTFTGTVYLDTNLNGVRDSGEPGQAVFWTNSNNPAPITISSANGVGSVGAGTNTGGTYTINVTNHPAGSDTYMVTMNPPSGFALTSISPVSVPVSSGGTKTVNFGLRSTITPTNTPTLTPIPTATFTPTPTSLPTPTFTPTPTLSPTPIPSPTISPTPVAGDTVFSIVLGLDGIGSAGDNAAPNNSSGSNKDPLHKTRDVKLEVYNSNNSLVHQVIGNVIYNPLGGQFEGFINVGNSVISGSYTIKLSSPGYLKKLVPGVQVLTTTNNINSVPLQPINLVAGDINLDNSINILDYNIFISCSIFSTDSGLCDSHSSYRRLSDLEDNGTVDQFDYNLFVREYSVQNGQ